MLFQIGIGHGQGCWPGVCALQQTSIPEKVVGFGVDRY